MKVWFRNKLDLIVACRNDTFAATITHSLQTNVATATQELTSLAVTTTFFPAAADQLVYEHGKDLQQQRHHVMSLIFVFTFLKFYC
jgi:hypothetical protein